MIRRVAISLSPIHQTSIVRFDHRAHELELFVPTVLIDIETLPGPLGRTQGVSPICELNSEVLSVPVHVILRASKNHTIHAGSYPSMTGFEFGI